MTPKVFIALPCYSSMPVNFVECLLRLYEKPLCDIEVKFASDSLVSRVRNYLAHEFLKSDCSHLMFIDTDILFSPAHIKKLLDRGQDVIGGPYPKKQASPTAWVFNSLPGEEKDASGLIKVRYIGTGFMMIHRSVLERMIAQYPEIAYRTDDGETVGGKEIRHDFFPVGIHQESGRYLSEDWYFCQRWHDMGGEVFLDLSFHVEHVGQINYPLSKNLPTR